MARGFESKSVQEQWLDAEAAREMRSKERLDPGEIEKRKQRENLELSRTRILRELDETRRDHRREQLRAALEHLEAELKKIE